MLHADCRPQRLAILLERFHRTPEQLSAQTEIPPATVRGYLNGGRNSISTRNLLLIARFFEMPMSELIDFLSESE